MTLIPPSCEPKTDVSRVVDKELIDTYYEVGMNIQTQLVGVINDQNENLYHLVNDPVSVDTYNSRLVKNTKYGTEIWNLLIKNNCGTGSIISKDLSFAIDGLIVVSGWVITKEEACFLDKKLSLKTTVNERKVPFIAFISSTKNVVQVISLEVDFPDASVAKFETDPSDSNKVYIILKMDSKLWIACYDDSKLLWKNTISTCNDITKCEVVGLNYSPFGKLVVTLYESNGNQFNFGYRLGITSAIYVLEMSITDGSRSSLNSIVYSITDNIGAPKTVLDHVGKLHVLFSCPQYCFMKVKKMDSERLQYVQREVYLIRYNCDQMLIEKVNSFISLTPSIIKLQSLAFDRDMNLYAIINGLSGKFSIVDSSRESTFSNVPVLCKFRYSDLKILWLKQISTDPTLDNFFVAPSSIKVNKNPIVGEYIPTMFTYLRDGKKRTIWIESFLSRHDLSDTTSEFIGGTGGNPYTTPDRITAIRFQNTEYTKSIGFDFNSGSSFNGGLSIRNVIDRDEYFTMVESCTDTFFGLINSVEYIKFITNKKSFSNGKCRSLEKLVTTTFPSDRYVYDIQVKYGSYLDSLTFFSRYPYNCMNGKEGQYCDSDVCFNIPSTSSQTCSGRGYCIGPNTCSCKNGYFGVNCEQVVTCFGVQFDDAQKVCSGNGACVSSDSCKCYSGSFGFECQNISCNGIVSTDSNVCSGHGSCVKPNTCSCRVGYFDSICSTFSCGGIPSDYANTCSSHGSCKSLNNCSCTNGYLGSNCNEFQCGGKYSNSSEVCSGRGTCVSPNVCQCSSTSFGTNCEKCKEGYFGSKCDKFYCNGIENSSPTTCSGRGICIYPDICACTETATGKFCEECVTGYFGQKCNNWTCNGIEKSSKNVCNHRGTCASPENCQCSARSNGVYCESCLGLFTGPLCSECSGHLEADEACLNYVSSDPEYSIAYGSESLRLNVISTASMGSTIYDCNNLFSNQKSEIGSSLECSVSRLSQQYSTTNIAYRITVKSIGYSSMNPNQPIHFNIFWAFPQKNPSYVALKISVKELYSMHSIILALKSSGYSSKLIVNRCYDTTIRLEYDQPEPRITFSSIQWSINNSNKLDGVSKIQQALETAKDKTYLTIPFVPELLANETLTLTVTFVSAFGQTAVKSFPLQLSEPYPNPQTVLSTRKVSFLNSEDVAIPLREFYENPECLNQGKIPLIVDYYASNQYRAYTTSDSIIIKAMSFNKGEMVPIVFYNGASVKLDISLLPFKAIIEESIVYYNFVQPSITISCLSHYGTSYYDRYAVYQGSSLVSSGAFYPPTMVVPVNVGSGSVQLKCFKGQIEYYQGLPYYENSNIYLEGSTTKYVAFVNEQASTSENCELLAFSLKTPNGGNLIPYSNDDQTFYMEVASSRSDCNLRVFYSTFQNQVELIKTKLSSVISSVPVVFKKSIFSIIDGRPGVKLDVTLDNSIQSQFFSVQERFFTTIENCVISPFNIEIGITMATFSCKSDIDTTSKRLELYHDGQLVGSSNSFPINFIASSSVQSFKVVVYDIDTGGKASKDILLVNSITFSTKSLLTSSFVTTISNQISYISQSRNTIFSDISNKNKYIVSMINNIGNALESTKKEIASLASTALDVSINVIANELSSSSSVKLSTFSTMVDQIKGLSNPQFLTDSNAQKTTEIVGKLVSTIHSFTIWDENISSSLSNIVTNISPKISETSTMSLVSKLALSVVSVSYKSSLTTEDFFPSTKKPSNLMTMNALKTSHISMNSISIATPSKIPLVSFQLSKHKTTSQANENIKVSHSVFKYPSKKRTTTSRRDFISQLSVYSSGVLEGKVLLNIPISYVPPISPLIKQTLQCLTVFDMKDFQVETYCKYVYNSKLNVTEFHTGAVIMVTCSCDLNYLSKQNQFSMIGVTAEYLEDDSAYIASESGKVAAGVIVALLFIFGFMIGSTLLMIGISVFFYLKRKKEMTPAQLPSNPQPSSSTINTSIPDFVDYSNNTAYEMGNFALPLPNLIDLNLDNKVPSQKLQPTSI